MPLIEGKRNPSEMVAFARGHHVKKQQLDLNMEQQAGSKLGKEYKKVLYCHPAYLTYMQSVLLLLSHFSRVQLCATP